jgi:hypothetical protein
MCGDVAGCHPILFAQLVDDLGLLVVHEACEQQE